jgi:protein-S-isoprenylcysteine O-methyltransferase Ste14
MPVIVAAIAHIGYMPGPAIPFGSARMLILGIAGLLAVVGLALWVRSMFAFGVDNLALLYVYFPEEGRLVDSSIYAVVRHPVYAAATYVCLALGLWRGTWPSLAFGLLAPFGLTVWLRLVEERELIERFGESYREYRRRVPAFYPRLQDWVKLLRFLATGN